MVSAAHGRFHWNELMTRDVEAAKTFYSKMMGWVFDEMKAADGVYYVGVKGDDLVGGISPMPKDMPADTPSYWLSYIEVDNVKALVGQVEAAGGTVLKAPADIPDVGCIAIVRDPTGAVIGWITPDFHD